MEPSLLHEYSPSKFVSHKDISFQDMQSIAKAFEAHLGVRIERTSDVNDLVLGQAARHVIVHNAGIVDKRMVRQLRSAQPRELRNQLEIGESLRFKSDEIELLSERMDAYLSDLVRRFDEWCRSSD